MRVHMNPIPRVERSYVRRLDNHPRMKPDCSRRAELTDQIARLQYRVGKEGMRRRKNIDFISRLQRKISTLKIELAKIV